jgi:hypothetical protein
MTDRQYSRLPMDPERARGYERTDDHWWRSRRALALCAAFAAPLALLVFAGSPLIVPAMYTVLAVEADAIMYLAIWRSQSVYGRKIRGEDRGGPVGSRTFLSADRVEVLASCVKWAGKDSDFSRREMAQTIARILGRSYVVSSGGSGETSDGNLSDSFRSVIYPYRDDPVVRAEMGAIGGKERFYGRDANGEGGPPKAGRGGYLASLEEIVSELERDMDRSGGP